MDRIPGSPTASPSPVVSAAPLALDAHAPATTFEVQRPTLPIPSATNSKKSVSETQQRFRSRGDFGSYGRLFSSPDDFPGLAFFRLFVCSLQKTARLGVRINRRHCRRLRAGCCGPPIRYAKVRCCRASGLRDSTHFPDDFPIFIRVTTANLTQNLYYYKETNSTVRLSAAVLSGPTANQSSIRFRNRLLQNDHQRGRYTRII